MLWLAYAEGASHRDIADVLGVETASLKAMLFRARRKVAALLGHAAGRDEEMTRYDCEFESEALAAALQSRWPERVDRTARPRDRCPLCSTS